MTQRKSDEHYPSFHNCPGPYNVPDEEESDPAHCSVENPTPLLFPEFESVRKKLLSSLASPSRLGDDVFHIHLGEFRSDRTMDCYVYDIRVLNERLIAWMQEFLAEFFPLWRILILECPKYEIVVYPTVIRLADLEGNGDFSESFQRFWREMERSKRRRDGPLEQQIDICSRLFAELYSGSLLSEQVGILCTFEGFKSSASKNTFVLYYKRGEYGSITKPAAEQGSYFEWHHNKFYSIPVDFRVDIEWKVRFFGLRGNAGGELCVTWGSGKNLQIKSLGKTRLIFQEKLQLLNPDE